MQTVGGLDVVGINNILPLPDYYGAVLDTASQAVDVLSQVVEATGKYMDCIQPSKAQYWQTSDHGLMRVAESRGVQAAQTRLWPYL